MTGKKTKLVNTVKTAFEIIELKVQKAIGIDNNLEKIQNAQKNMEGKNINAKFIHQNIEKMHCL